MSSTLVFINVTEDATRFLQNVHHETRYCCLKIYPPIVYTILVLAARAHTGTYFLWPRFLFWIMTATTSHSSWGPCFHPLTLWPEWCWAWLAAPVPCGCVCIFVAWCKYLTLVPMCFSACVCWCRNECKRGACKEPDAGTVHNLKKKMVCTIVFCSSLVAVCVSVVPPTQAEPTLFSV